MNKMDNFFQEGSKWKFIYRFWHHRHHHHLYPVSFNCVFIVLLDILLHHIHFLVWLFTRELTIEITIVEIIWENCRNTIFFKLHAIILILENFIFFQDMRNALKLFFKVNSSVLWLFFKIKPKEDFVRDLNIYHATLILKCETSKLLMHAWNRIQTALKRKHFENVILRKIQFTFYRTCR